MGNRAILVARCENEVEQPDLTAIPCKGELHFEWGMQEAACKTCGAYCGVAVAEWIRVEPARGDSTDPDRHIPGAVAHSWFQRIANARDHLMNARVGRIAQVRADLLNLMGEINERINVLTQQNAPFVNGPSRRRFPIERRFEWGDATLDALTEDPSFGIEPGTDCRVIVEVTE
jgi:hypothetical protein